MQHFLSHPQLLNVNYFHKKSSIIDVWVSSKYTSDKLSFSSDSKSMLSFKLLSFDFLLKENLTLLTMLVKKIHCKMENGIGKYYHWYSQKNLQKFQNFQFPAVSNSHEWQYWISSGLSRPNKILSTAKVYQIIFLIIYYILKNILSK